MGVCVIPMSEERCFPGDSSLWLLPFLRQVLGAFCNKPYLCGGRLPKEDFSLLLAAVLTTL